MSNRGLSVVALGVLLAAAAGAVWSCVGEDPALSVETASPDGSAGPSDGATSDGAANDGSAQLDASGAADAASNSDAGPLATGLALWLRADLGITANGTKVSAWADQSGNGRDLANGTSSTQPELPTGDVAFGGRRSMRFLNLMLGGDPQAAGGSEVLRSVAPVKPIPAPATAYFVYRGGDPSVKGGLFLFESGTKAGNDHQNLVINSGSTTWNFSWVTQLNGGTATGFSVDQLPNATVSSGHLLILVLDSSSAAYLDHHATANTTSVTLPNATMGDFNLGATMLAQNGLNGAIAEVMVYSGAHGPTERKTVADYVSSRYGLTIQP